MNKNCNQELLEKYFDKEIANDEKLLIEDHLKSCPKCQDYLKATERLSEIIKRPVYEAIEKEDFSILWNKIERQLQPRSTIWGTIISWLDISYLFRKSILIPAMAAAVILFLVLIPFIYKKTTSLPPLSVVEYVESQTHNLMIFESEKNKVTIIWLFEEKIKELPNS